MKTPIFLSILLLSFVSIGAYASGGGKEKGDWHIKNESSYQVIVNVYYKDGQPCFTTYLDPHHKAGFPEKMQKCRFPGLKVEVKAMQRDKEGSCEIILDEMSDVVFDGKECKQG